jgi:hypothetical protein
VATSSQLPKNHSNCRFEELLATRPLMLAGRFDRDLSISLHNIPYQTLQIGRNWAAFELSAGFGSLSLA